MLHAGAAVNAGDDHLARNVRIVLSHHEADVVLGRLRLVDKHHLGRLELGHLPHDFRSDRTGGTGNEDALAGELLAHRLHVHADFVAREEVLHADLLDLHRRLVVDQGAVLDIGFLGGIVGHEDLAAGADKEVLQGLVGAEFGLAQGAHDDGLDALVSDDGGEVVVDGIDPHAEELHVGDAGLMGDKAAELELRRGLGTNVLGDADTAGQGTVDKGTQGAGVGVIGVEEELHQQAQGPHEHRRDDEGGQGLQQRQAGEQGDFLPLHNQQDAYRKDEGYRIGIDQLEQVHEAGIAQDAGIGPEDPRADPAQGREHQGCQERRLQGLGTYVGPMHHPPREEAGSKNNQRINRQDHPVRQYLTAENPACQFLYRIHCENGMS